jgi:hypothetical protein
MGDPVKERRNYTCSATILANIFSGVSSRSASRGGLSQLRYAINMQRSALRGGCLPRSARHSAHTTRATRFAVRDAAFADLLGTLKFTAQIWAKTGSMRSRRSGVWQISLF